MKIKSLGLKVSLIVALMFAAIVAIIIYFVTARSLYLVEKLAANEAAASRRNAPSGMPATADSASRLAAP